MSGDCDVQSASQNLGLGGLGQGGSNCHCCHPWEVIGTDGIIIRGEVEQVVGRVALSLLSSSDSCWHHWQCHQQRSGFWEKVSGKGYIIVIVIHGKLLV